jgi:hypothetical protein
MAAADTVIVSAGPWRAARARPIRSPPGGGINVTVRLAVTSSSTDGDSCRAGFTMKS